MLILLLWELLNNKDLELISGSLISMTTKNVRAGEDTSLLQLLVTILSEEVLTIDSGFIYQAIMVQRKKFL